MKRNGFRFSTLALVAVFSAAGSLAQADPMAWAADGNGYLQSIDLTTGASTSVGFMGSEIYGLADFGSNLYATSGMASGLQLLTVNTSNGSVTADPVNANTPSPYALGSTLSGIYSEGTDGNVYSFNPTTGVSTMLGASGVSLAESWGALSTGSSSLYVLYTNFADSEQFVGQVNLSNGAVTTLGQIATTNPSLDAMTYVGGQWYVGTGNGSDIFTLNLSTLTLTPVSTAPGIANGFFGLAPMATPEPTPFVVCGLGLLGLCVRRRRR